jgi:hypothetical protein
VDENILCGFSFDKFNCFIYAKLNNIALAVPYSKCLEKKIDNRQNYIIIFMEFALQGLIFW